MYEILLCVDADGTNLDRQLDAVTDLPSAADAIHVAICHVFGENPSGKALFGSVSQSVILNAERPVFVAGLSD